MTIPWTGIGPIGQLEDYCPSCGAALSVRPKRRRLCEHCGEPIHVRLRPSDNRRVLLSRREADHLERQWRADRDIWSVAMDGHFPAGQAFHKALRAGEPVSWSALQDAAVTLMNDRIRARRWGMARNSLSMLGAIAWTQGNASLALSYGLTVLVIDTAGPMNHGGWGGPTRLLPGMVRQVAGYMVRPDWRSIRRDVSQAEDLVRGWGGQPDGSVVLDALAVEIRCGGPESAL